MKIAADASALVAEALRTRGRYLIEHHDLDLYIAAPIWSETEHELRRRIYAMAQHGRLGESARDLMLQEALSLLTRHVTVVAEAEYSQHETVARARIPRDPNDWPTVAVALALDAGVWTNDYELVTLGSCGAPVWITETITPHLGT